MSDGKVIIDGTEVVEPKSKAGEPDDSGRSSVPTKAYEEMQRDMHKYKNRDKDSQLIINEQAAKIKSMEEQTLVEEKRWEELYNKEKDDRLALEKTSYDAREKFDRAVKMSNLKSELGGKVKDAYLQFADLSSIELKDDGTIDPDSLHLVANEFRQSYPELIPSDSKAKITNAGVQLFGQHQAEKSLSDMSYAEKAQMLKELKENKNRS